MLLWAQQRRPAKNASLGSPRQSGRPRISKDAYNMKLGTGASPKIRAGTGTDGEWGRGEFCQVIILLIILQIVILQI